MSPVVRMKTAVHRLRNLPHTRNILINTFGSYLGFAFAGFYIVFFVRVFNPVEFGTLTVLQAFSYLLANILSFGMPATIYAHIPTFGADKKKAFNFIASNFGFLTLLSMLSLVAIYLGVDELDRLFFKTGASHYQFLLALIGTQCFIWQNFIQDVLNAKGRFLHINIATNLSNVVKTVILFWFALQGSLTIASVLFVMGVVGPATVLGYVIYNRVWIIKTIFSSRMSRENIQFGYTFTYFAATQVYGFAMRAGLFLVAYYLTRPEVGYYGLSQRIILAVVTSSDSITQVMSPQFARLTSQAEVKKTLKHSLAYMLLPTAMFVGAILVPNGIYDWIFGFKYSSSTLLTKALSLAYLPYSFVAALLLFFLYTIKKPYYLLISNSLFFVIIVVCHLMFVPHFRIYGPVFSYFTAFVVIGMYLSSVFMKEMKSLPVK